MKNKSIYKLILLIALLLPSVILALEVNNNVEISETIENYGPVGNLTNASVVQTSDGGYIIGASNHTDVGIYINDELIPSNGGYDYYFIKYDSKNNLEWWNQFGGNDNVEIYGDRSFLIEVDGGYVFVGTTTSTDIEGLSNNGSADIVIVKYDKKGKLLWQKNYGGNKYETITKVLKDKNGNITIIFSSPSATINGLNSNGDNDIFIVNFNSNGKIMWQTQWGGNKGEFISDVLLTENNEYLIIGHSYSSNILGLTNKGEEDAMLLKYDEDGNLLWQQAYGGTSTDFFDSISVTEDGYFVHGRSSSPTINGQKNEWKNANVIVKYSKDGKIINNTCYEGKSWSASNDTFFYTEEGYGFDIYMIGDISASDVAIVKFDKNGDIIWRKTYGGSGEEYFVKHTLVEDEGILIQVETTSNDLEEISLTEDINYVLLKYNKQGELEWKKRIGLAWNLTNDDGYIIAENHFIFKENATTKEDNDIKDIDVYIKKYDKNWKLEWQHDYTEPSIDMIETIEELPNGKYRAKGITITEMASNKYKVLQMDLSVTYTFKTSETANGTYRVEQDGNKGIITLLPDNGYTLDKLEVKDTEGTELETYEEEKQQYSFDLYDDVSVNVTYKEEVKNPNTNSSIIIGFIFIIVFIIYTIIVSKRIMINKYN